MHRDLHADTVSLGLKWTSLHMALCWQWRGPQQCGHRAVSGCFPQGRNQAEMAGSRTGQGWDTVSLEAPLSAQLPQLPGAVAGPWMSVPGQSGWLWGQKGLLP